MSGALPLFDDGRLADDETGFDGMDRCYTPRLLAAQLVQLTIDVYGGPAPGQRAIEPSAGGGAFVEALAAHGVDVVAVDADAAARGLGMAWRHRVGDWRRSETRSWAVRTAGLGKLWGVLGNPPFAQMEEHIPKCFGLGAQVVGMLMPLHLLESGGRLDWWEGIQMSPMRLASVHVLAERIPFTGSTKGYPKALAWFVWLRDYSGSPTVDIISRSGRRPLLAGGDS